MARKYVHSAKTRSLVLTKSSKVSLLSCATSEAASAAEETAAAASRPRAILRAVYMVKLYLQSGDAMLVDVVLY